METTYHRPQQALLDHALNSMCVCMHKDLHKMWAWAQELRSQETIPDEVCLHEESAGAHDPTA